MEEEKKNFNRGEIYYCELLNTKDETDVLYGGHRVLVLFDSDFPNNTVTVLPITSRRDKDGKLKHLPEHYVELIKEEYIQAGFPYKNAIQHDSMIKTDQITTVDRSDLESKKGAILPRDEIEMDVKMITTLGLKNTLNTLLERKVIEILEAKGVKFNK